MEKVLIKNDHAHRDYEILETYTAGIELEGHEVKALKRGTGSIRDSFAALENGNLILVKANIPPYQPGNVSRAYDPYRARRLLLEKHEIREIMQAKEEGLTVIPLVVQLKGNLVKVRLGLAKKKKKYDKREAIKKRESDREIARTLKQK